MSYGDSTRRNSTFFVGLGDVGRASSHGESIRCTLVGDAKVGKTSMLLSFQADSFPTQHVPTMFDSYSKRIKYESCDVNLLLYDTGGGNELTQFGPQGSIGTDIFLLCFSVDDPNSFDNISEKWIDEVQRGHAMSVDSAASTNISTT